MFEINILCKIIFNSLVFYIVNLLKQDNMNLEQLLTLEYINIQDNAELRSLIDNYNFHINIKIKQLQELGNIRDKNKDENESVVNKMYSMQKQNRRKKKKYQLDNEQWKIRQEHKKNEIIEEHERNLRAAQAKHQQDVHLMSAQIEKLKQQYEKMKQSQKEEQKLLNEIKQKSIELINRQYDHHDNMNKQQTKQVQENKQLLLKNRDLIKELKRDIKMEAGRIVYQEKYENQDKNYELKVRLFQLQDQVSRLRKERNLIVKNRNQQKINSSLNEQEIEQYKAVGSIQKSKIKSYTDKVESLKKTITSQISKMENRIKQKKSKWENQLKSLKLKFFHFQKEKEELKLNLQRYKLLGETILMQREEVEQFFLMAIQSCKKQMESHQHLLESNSNQKQYGEKVDIDQLLPKDKHRIITNLYTKLALAPSK